MMARVRKLAQLCNSRDPTVQTRLTQVAHGWAMLGWSSPWESRFFLLVPWVLTREPCLF